MSDQVRDLLTRLANEAGPPPHDPTLWQRARRARRRERLLAGSAAVAAVVAVAIGSISGFSALRASTPETANRPDGAQASSVPTLVGDPAGTGGLPLRRHLAVGTAALAIANDTSAFVVTEAGGVLHRLDLPGFDAPLYDRGGADVSGIALAPDGTRLAFGWHGPDDAKPLESGVRIVDLRTGEVTTLPRPSLYVEQSKPRLLTWGFSWSPDGRYLFTRVKVTWPDNANPWSGNAYWDGGYDTTTGARAFESERGAGKNLEPGSDLSSPVRVAPTGVYTRVVGSDMVLWRSNPTGSDGVPIPLPPGTEASSWPTGRFDDTGGRLVLEPAGVGRSVLLVFTEGVFSSGEATGGSALELPLPTSLWPQGARVDLQGLTDPRRAVAMFHRPAGSGSGWLPGADLVRLSSRRPGDEIGQTCAGTRAGEAPDERLQLCDRRRHDREPHQRVTSAARDHERRGRHRYLPAVREGRGGLVGRRAAPRSRGRRGRRLRAGPVGQAAHLVLTEAGDPSRPVWLGRRLTD